MTNNEKMKELSQEVLDHLKAGGLIIEARDDQDKAEALIKDSGAGLVGHLYLAMAALTEVFFLHMQPETHLLPPREEVGD